MIPAESRCAVLTRANLADRHDLKAWLAKLDTSPDNGGGLSVDPRLFPNGDDFRGLRVHQTRLQGGDASTVRPPMDGLDLAWMHVLQAMGDMFALQHVLAAGGTRSALIVERHLRLLDEWEASSRCWLGQVAAAGQLHERELTAGGGGRCRLGVDRFTPRRAAWYSCSCAAGDPGTIPG